MRLLLCAYLGVWIPFNFAAALLGALPSISRRGPGAWLELGFHGVAAAISVAAARMLLSRHEGARVAGVLAVALSTAASIQPLFWTALPLNVAPGQRGPLAALFICIGVAGVLAVVRITRNR